MKTLADLEKGYEFPPASFTLTDDWVDGYISAVEDEAIAAALGDGAVPPMAVAALGVRALLEHAGLPTGTLHAGQELAFSSPVRRGDTLTASARVGSRGERAGWVLMGVDLRVERPGETVMTGRGLLSFPLAEGAAA
jgi:acyl dehydratase